LQQKEEYIGNASETKLLIRIQAETDQFQKEIFNGLLTYHFILPLVNIICDYGLSPLHIMGKIIAQFKNDITKYSKLL
ncbi:MAG: hypothetical protein Harvfovirus88_1, partial [Harvfovirus sp.]